MSTVVPPNSLSLATDDKRAIEEIEMTEDSFPPVPQNRVPEYESLSVWQTTRLFWRSFLIALGISIGA